VFQELSLAKKVLVRKPNMFLLSFLPDWFFFGLLLLAVVGTFAGTLLSKIPFIATYSTPIKYGSIATLLFSVYMVGGIANEESWQKKVLEQKAEIALLKQKEAEVTTKVVTKYIDKLTVVKETNNAISKYVTTEADGKCQLPNSFSVLHDAAAKNELPDPTGAVDARASEVKLSEATTTIIENYGICNQNSEQLKALQDWVSQQKKLNP
jgi:hypothetical protein